jgi:hypothetical protein
VTDPLKPLTDRLLEIAVVLLLAALALRWAWAVFQPLLPVAVGGGVLYGFIVWQRHRR